MIKKKKLLLKNFEAVKILFTVVLILSISICLISSKNTVELKMVIGYIPHVQFTPLYAGISKGFFEQEGISLSIQYGFSIDAFSLLQQEKIDFALSDSDQLITGYEKGAKLRAFYQYYQDYPVSIIALDHIKKPEDLIGKRIGVPMFFGTNYIGVLLFLSKNNLMNKVELVKIGYSQISSLLSKHVDAVVCFYNNEPIQLKSKNIPFTEWRVRDYSSIVGASFISTDKLLNKKNNEFNSFTVALKKATQWLVENPEEALSIAYEQIGSLNPEEKPFWREVLLSTITLYYSQHGFGVINKQRYSDSISLLYELGIISEKFESDLILYSFK